MTPPPEDDGTAYAAGSIARYWRDRWWAAITIASEMMCEARAYHRCLELADDYGEKAAGWSDEQMRRYKGELLALAQMSHGG